MRPGGHGTAGGVAAAGPEDLSAALAEDRDLFGHGPCEGVSPGGLLDSRNGHGVEVHPLKASSVGGSLEQAGDRSTPGEVGDLRLPSFRVTTLLVQDGARRFPAGAGGQHMFAGDRLAPVL